MTIDMTAYLKLMGALVLVLALFAIAAWAAKRYLPGAGRVGARPGRRLSVIEVVILDTRRRLVLVRRDDVEHLILLGTTSETVVERGIGLPASMTPSAAYPAAQPSRSFSDHVQSDGEPPR